MEFGVTVTQFTAIKAAMGAQALVIYALDGTDPTKVGRISMLDPKLGGTMFSWTTLDIAPTEAAFLVEFPSAIKVEAVV